MIKPQINSKLGVKVHIYRVACGVCVNFAELYGEGIGYSMVKESAISDASH
jgi:hypothetical protein